MLTGTIEIIWSGPEVEAFRGAERLWTFCLERGLRLRDRLPVRWSFGEMSPHNAMTGTWSEAEATLQAEAARETWRPYRVGRIVDESDEIRSFYLEPSDGGALPSFRAGQHIPIRVTPPECGKPVIRTYTLSSAPGDMSFRISVKREQKGLVSRYLHDDISVGDVIEVKAPRGGFTFDATDRRPAVLLSGGVGVTPMISMLRYAVAEGFRTRYTRPCTFVHSARTTDARAFYDEARNLEAASGGATRVVSAVGRRIDKEMLSQLLALDDYEFYLCGPGPFMQAMYTALRELGVRDARILAEAFGPSTLSRQPDPDAPRSPELAPAADDAIIQFGRSKFSMPWKPEDGSLLDLAESHGLTPDFSCRRGSCGTCAVRVCSGQVTYNSTPEAEIPQDMALLCQAVPARSDSDEAIVLDL